MTSISRAALLLGLLCVREVAADDNVFELFGGLNIAYDWRNDALEELDENDWQSYSSKLGFVGHYHVLDGFEAVYEWEESIDPIHGGTKFSDLTELGKAIVGVRGQLGTLMFGTYDTPLNMAQLGVDLFTDQRGDIEALVAGDVTVDDSVLYYSPAWKSWQVQAMHVPSDDDFSSSASLSLLFESDEVQLGFAVDSNMRRNNLPVEDSNVRDTHRVAAQYTPGGWSFGLLLERSKKQGGLDNDWASAYIGSVSYKLGKIAALAQYGRSNIVRDKAKSRNLGLEYHFSDGIKAYLYHWDFNNSRQIDTVSLGLKLTF